MFNVNIDVLEIKLSKLFEPMTDLVQLLDNIIQGNLENETKTDFLLRLLIRNSEIFS